jgi:hypothetical protein
MTISASRLSKKPEPFAAAQQNSGAPRAPVIAARKQSTQRRPATKVLRDLIEGGPTTGTTFGAWCDASAS